MRVRSGEDHKCIPVIMLVGLTVTVEVKPFTVGFMCTFQRVLVPRATNGNVAIIGLAM